MKRKLLVVTALLLVAFLGWRFVRPMQIFVVSPTFERPIDTRHAPAMFPTLSALECASCHQDFYDEWSTTIHSQAWTDPYFQVDWKFDGSSQICKNCHIPLDRQQEYKVLGFNDAEKWNPILESNSDFDAQLQHEGVTCNVCHLRNGKILGVLGNTNAPHPMEKLNSANQICVTCHVVSGKHWDTFLKMPPCGTVAEIRTHRGLHTVETAAEMTTDEIDSLGCVDCHMPLRERPIVEGGPVRLTRQHLWRGGHDPDMVKKGLTLSFNRVLAGDSDNSQYILSITNSGAAHFIPTGTPDRHLTIHLKTLDLQQNVLTQKEYSLKRTVMWRPFIVDLWDTRLPRDEQRDYLLEVDNRGDVAFVDALVEYHLLDEARRNRIGYKNESPIHYPIFQQRLPVALSSHLQQ